VIKFYHRGTAKFDKEAYITEFQRLGEDCSISVIFTTKLGMDINLQNSKQKKSTIQFATHGIEKLPQRITSLIGGTTLTQNAQLSNLLPIEASNLQTSGLHFFVPSTLDLWESQLKNARIRGRRECNPRLNNVQFRCRRF
jgi:hypothetical protein